MEKSWKLVVLFSVAFLVSGCATYSARIKDTSDVYSMPTIEDAPKVIVSDLSDNRDDKKKLGTVGALNLTSDTAINVILTNRIASRLREAGFNVEKINLSDSEDDNEVSETLSANNGKILLTGTLDSFSVSSFDAIMETGKGTVNFYIKVVDENGNVIFSKNYSGYAENYIGLTVQFGCEKLIEQSVQASVDNLFEDREFKAALSRVKG